MANASLKKLARLYGVNVDYVDVWKKRRQVADESLVRVLQLLGAPLADSGGADAAVRQRRQEIWRRALEPVFVAWEGLPAAMPVRLPVSSPATGFRWRLDYEQGGGIGAAGAVVDLPLRGGRRVEGVSYEVRLIRLPDDRPLGYHRLAFECGGREAACLVIAAPRRCYCPEESAADRLWGVFAPLYALYRKSTWGAGDFSDLEALMRWTSERGGDLVATLPLLASLWELSADPSPYSAASRLFWNEFYLDPRQVPEFATCGAAREMLGALDRRAAEAAGPSSRLIDYPRLARRKRQVLEKLSEAFFDGPSHRLEELQRHCRENPSLEDFARFRAVGERQGRTWDAWPEPMRGGTIGPGDYDESVYRYHLYAQWVVAGQLRAMAERARRMRLLWYLDFPLGVGGDGYDVWRERELFVGGASGGAPPDAFFTKGQDWGFPPMHPAALRQHEYGYLIRALRTHLQHARVLRLDHVMGLYRLYWIPHGFPADAGAYVRYPMDEFFAILALESQRYRARIVGENLGTVPEPVDEALRRYGVDDMYVLQYETNPDKGPALRAVAPTAVASINTHDMPQFAAYWQGLDIDSRVGLGLLKPEEAAAEHARRAKLRDELTAFFKAEGLLDRAADLRPLDVLEACLAYLARSPARIVLVNLEDLWGETEPQNVPGTFREVPNWRRKFRYGFEEFRDRPAVLKILETVDRLRREAGGRRVDEDT